MKRVEAAHRFDVPLERGFAFVTQTKNWSKFWPGYVRLEDGSSWGAPGDEARLVTRLLGRERLVRMRDGRSFRRRRAKHARRSARRLRLQST